MTKAGKSSASSFALHTFVRCPAITRKRHFAHPALSANNFNEASLDFIMLLTPNTTNLAPEPI